MEGEIKGNKSSFKVIKFLQLKRNQSYNPNSAFSNLKWKKGRYQSKISWKKDICATKYTKQIEKRKRFGIQNLRSLWLKSRDKNTTFFHKQTKARLQKNK